MSHHHKINYIEIPVKDIQATKQFFANVFDWQFVDYGEDYAAIVNAGIDGGFFSSNQTVSTANGSVLVVLYSADLAASQTSIEQAGGLISKPIFSFPGGRRFHFTDGNFNEYAMWSDK